MDAKMKGYFKGFCAVAVTSLLFLPTVTEARGKGPDGVARLPKGCMNEGFEFKYNMTYLHPSQAGNYDSVYFFFNDSNQAINLLQAKKVGEYHVTELNNRIHARQWGVYSTDEDNVKFICTTSSSKFRHGDIVDCEKHLKICEFSDVLYGLNNRGNFWMVNSTSRNSAVRGAIRYGVLLSRGHY
jgi:hypothetical protein